MWNNKRFHSLNYALKEEFGEKIYKVSLDGGFTCPNRDGKVGSRGCIFCSDAGSGEYAGSRSRSITEQIEEQLILISKKFPKGKVIAYFQNFTNTYGDTEYLESIYREALAHPRVAGLAIATRPDALPSDVIDLLTDIHREHYLWIELGLQTMHDHTAELINRGYDLEVFNSSVKKLVERGIKVVTHLIVGLPGEEREDILKSVEYINSTGVWGVKIHLLHIIRDTALHRLYEKTGFKVMEEQEYIDLICDMIAILHKDIIIHRLTGDGSRDTLIAPIWSLNKRGVLNSIDKRLKERDIVQGSEK